MQSKKPKPKTKRKPPSAESLLRKRLDQLQTIVDGIVTNANNITNAFNTLAKQVGEIQKEQREALASKRSDSDKLDQISKKLDQNHSLLTGDSVPDKGIVIRLDRIEQRAAQVNWVMGAVGVAAISALVKGFFFN